MRNDNWLQLLSRAVQIHLQGIARSHETILVVRELGVRMRPMFGPYGPFYLNEQGTPVPASAYLPINGSIFMPDGSQRPLQTDDFPDAPTEGPDVKIHIVDNDETHASLIVRRDNLRSALQDCCNKYDVRIFGTTHFLMKPLGFFQEERHIAGSALVGAEPREILKVALDSDCKGQTDEAEVFILETRAGITKVGKPFVTTVPRGMVTIRLMMGTQRLGGVLLDITKEKTLQFTCTGAPIANLIGESSYGQEIRPEGYVLPAPALDYLNKRVGEFSALVTNEVDQRAQKQPAKHPDSAPQEQALHSKIRPTPTGTFDAYGNQTARCRTQGDRCYWLVGEAYQQFIRFTTDLAKRKEFRGEVGINLIRELTFDWIVERVIDGRSDLTFSDHLLQTVNVSVKKHRIAVPIDLLEIERDISIGHVDFQRFDANVFDAMTEEAKRSEGDNVQRLLEAAKYLKSEWEGKVFGVITVHADREQAIQIAVEEVEQAMVLLRFYSPFALDPELPCLFGPLGKKHVPSTNVWVLDTSTFPTTIARSDVLPPPIFTLSKRVLDQMMNGGFRRASGLIRQHSRSDLEKLVFRCISIFVHGIETVDSLDRLVFTLAAIETLLLVGDNGPIQQTVALRLGYLCADTADERRNVRSILTTAYSQRSRYLHHGQEDRDIAVLRELQRYVWLAINNVIMLSEHLKEPTDLYDLIEQSVLS